uniref:Uncharacterized protein n=1 Tax=Caenorhabditis japonica TaxID=281687 RepID=A0A8R1IGA0_CAEJA
MEINQTAYIAAVFFPPDHHGDPRFSYQCGFGVLLTIAIMMVPFNIVITTGIKSVAKIKEFPTSIYGKDLQMQLYKALVAQVYSRRMHHQPRSTALFYFQQCSAPILKQKIKF